MRLRAADLGRYGWAIAGLTLLAALLRFPTLGVQSFWKDEAVTVVRILRPSLWQTLATIPHSEATPPFYYVLAWLWTRVFGTTEFGIRSLSALIGTATVPAAYLAAVRILPRRAALAGAALLACSPYLIWYAQEARAYALLALLGALSFLFFLQARTTTARASWVAWAVVSALALATHYFAVFIVAPEALWLLLRAPRRREAILAVGLVAVAGLALLPLAITQAHQGHDGWIHRLPLTGRVSSTASYFLIGPSGAPMPLLTLAAGTLVLAALWLLAVRSDPDERAGARTAALLAGAALVLPLGLSVVGVDFLFHRNLIVSLVPAALVVAAGAGARRAGALGIALTVALCAVSLAAVLATDTERRHQRADWRSVARALPPVPGGRAIVTPSLGDEPLEHYLARTAALHGAAAVGEVDLLGWPAAGTPTPSAPAGFSLSERRRVGAFTLIRYRALAATLVRRASLAQQQLGPEHPGVLISEPVPQR
ncbi:MAG: hypothetical protein NVSMB51_22180 [Solirubrobacteraceae bacterium]